jgi:ornithine cyclodeaminase/alanine dehydrogenase-like protein (mu-crystallin family)
MDRSAMPPIFVRLDETKRLISVQSVLEVSEDVFRMQARGQVTWCDPPRFTIRGQSENIYSHVKGCVLEAIPVLGVRIVAYHIHPDGSGTSSPEATRLVLLSDPATGRLLAIVDEHWNYSIRTTAAAVVGAKYLARPDAQTVGIVGAGNLARSGLLALSHVFPLKRALVTSRRADSYQAFARQMSDTVGILVEPRPTADEVCAGADIILVATTAGTPLVSERAVAPGSCLITLGNNEIERSLYARADKVVVDDRQEVGRSLRAILNADTDAGDGITAEIQEVVTGRKPGRERADERIVIRTVGLVSQDVAVAYRAYQNALEQGLGIPMI